MPTLAENLSFHRAQAGLNRHELAYKAGVSHMTIWRLEDGTAENPTIGTLRLLAIALGVSLHDLLPEGDDAA